MTVSVRLVAKAACQMTDKPQPTDRQVTVLQARPKRVDQPHESHCAWGDRSSIDATFEKDQQPPLFTGQFR